MDQGKKTKNKKGLRQADHKKKTKTVNTFFFKIETSTSV